jgi:hypothetical protein
VAAVGNDVVRIHRHDNMDSNDTAEVCNNSPAIITWRLSAIQGTFQFLLP